MSFDVKAKIDELVGKIQKDPAMLKSFQNDPIKTVEKLTGVDLPDDQLKPLVAGRIQAGPQSTPPREGTDLDHWQDPDLFHSPEL